LGIAFDGLRLHLNLRRLSTSTVRCTEFIEVLSMTLIEAPSKWLSLDKQITAF
jgi:hypothetical protein